MIVKKCIKEIHNGCHYYSAGNNKLITQQLINDDVKHNKITYSSD